MKHITVIISIVFLLTKLACCQAIQSSNIVVTSADKVGIEFTSIFEVLTGVRATYQRSVSQGNFIEFDGKVIFDGIDSRLVRHVPEVDILGYETAIGYRHFFGRNIYCGVGAIHSNIKLTTRIPVRNQEELTQSVEVYQTRRWFASEGVMGLLIIIDETFFLDLQIKFSAGSETYSPLQDLPSGFEYVQSEFENNLVVYKFEDDVTKFRFSPGIDFTILFPF